jgi:gluconokinase
MAEIVVVMGVAGSGQTTVGRILADALHWPFLEGDSLHSPANVETMSHGIPLTDADRVPWLAAIHARLLDALARGQSLVAACSALKQAYRARDSWLDSARKPLAAQGSTRQYGLAG